MSFIPTGWGEVTLRWRPFGVARDVTTVWGFQNDTLDAAPAIATAVNGICTGANGLGQASGFTTTYFWRGVRVVIERGTGPEIAEITANTAGTLVADPVPPNVSLLVRKTTALGGRRHRGRSYLPPIYSSELTVDWAGVITGAAVTTVQTRVDAFRTSMAGAGYDLAILHSVSEIAPTLISTTPVQAVVATQRRRLRR